MNREASRVVTWSLTAAALVVACSEPPVLKSSGTTAASASEVASAAPVPEIPKMEIPEGELAESDRSRDPFRSFAAFFVAADKGRQRSQRDVLLDQYSLDELKLIGIVTGTTPQVAMLVDPTGKGHVVRRGQFIGRAETVQPRGAAGAAYEVNWRVDAIRDGDIVLIREDPANPEVPTATRVIPLRPEAEAVGG